MKNQDKVLQKRVDCLEKEIKLVWKETNKRDNRLLRTINEILGTSDKLVKIVKIIVKKVDKDIKNEKRK